jgi:hypothetical protein
MSGTVKTVKVRYEHFEVTREETARYQQLK